MSKTALVTGAAGFVGRHMCRALARRGFEVDEIDIANTRPHQDTWVHDALRLFKTNEKRYDLVIHLAAIVGGRAKIDGDPLAVAQNVELDAAFFRWAARTRQPRVVYYSSSAVYPTHMQSSSYEWQRLREAYQGPAQGTILGMPDQTYGWGKLTGEYLSQYAVAEGVKVHIFRPFSGYGWDQSLDYPFPAFAYRIREVKESGDPFVIWGSETQTRDWIHISDVINATLTAVDRDIYGPVNLCTGVATSMRDLALEFGRQLDFEPNVVADKSKPLGVIHRVGDPTLLHEFYTPKISVEQGVSEALERIY